MTVVQLKPVEEKPNKFCKDCKHFRELPESAKENVYISFLGEEADRCCSTLNGVSPLNGSPYCKSAVVSRRNGPCGPEGKGFEQRPEPEQTSTRKKPWWRIW